MKLDLSGSAYISPLFPEISGGRGGHKPNLGYGSLEIWTTMRPPRGPRISPICRLFSFAIGADNASPNFPEIQGRPPVKDSQKSEWAPRHRTGGRDWPGFRISYCEIRAGFGCRGSGSPSRIFQKFRETSDIQTVSAESQIHMKGCPKSC